MTLLVPGFIAAAGLTVLGIFGIHLLASRDTEVDRLPTARFLPGPPLPARSRTIRPSDPWLLLLRAMIVLLVGLGLAGPQVAPIRVAEIRIVAVDVSRAVGDPTELLDSARLYLPEAGAVVLFDSSTSVLGVHGPDSLALRLSNRAAKGSLSAALVAARRIAAELKYRADSLELVLISPFVRESLDAATDTLRALWPGRVTTVAVAAKTLVGEDSATVEWADSGAISGWRARETPEAIAGLSVGDAVAIGDFSRTWRLAGEQVSGHQVIGRWLDGEPAAFEVETEAGCTRSLGFAMPRTGDAITRPSLQRLIEAVEAPCGPPRDFRVLSPAALAGLRGEGPLLSTAQIPGNIRQLSAITPWLLLVAALLSIAEMVLRRRGAADATVEPPTAAGPG